MVHLSTFERTRVVAIFNDLKEQGVGNKFKKAKQRGIDISESGVRLIMAKWFILNSTFSLSIIYKLSSL